MGLMAHRPLLEVDRRSHMAGDHQPHLEAQLFGEHCPSIRMPVFG
jgi:hypothetical protein